MLRYNNGTADVSVVDMLLSDNHGHQYDRNLTLGAAGCPQTVPPATYLTFCRNGAALLGLTSYPGCGFLFGVGDNDVVNLYASTSHAVLLDTTGTQCCAGVNLQAMDVPVWMAQALSPSCRSARPASPMCGR